MKRGYTIVELMMALAIFALGVTGVVAMEKVTSTSNAHAKNLAIASHIAESWLEKLTVDASTWTQTATSMNNTIWLKSASSAWVLPADNATNAFGPGFDALGNYTTTAANVRFCAHVKLSPLLGIAGTGLIRTEVRVFWPKEGGGYKGTDLCGDTAAAPATVATATSEFHFVNKSSAVRQTAMPQ